MTVLVAAFADQPRIDGVLRPLYFALLFSFFHAIGRKQPEIRALPFRLIEAGFLVLTLGFTAAATFRGLGIELGTLLDGLLLSALERGAVFLLGLTLISYGIILWVPQLLESQRVLRERYHDTRGKLKSSERARWRMEKRFVEADRIHAVGELAAGVAHDLRNPLAIIKGAAGSLSRGQRSRAELDEHAQVICRNIDRAERTISALLELGKPHSFSPVEFSINNVAAEVISLVRVEARRRRIAVERSGDTAVTAFADPKLLSQALLNLVLNALQASPDGSRVTVVTRGFELGGQALAAIAVEDRGHGIDGPSRDKLFSPFFTTKSDGTGLGLLSTRRIMDEMNGGVALFTRQRGGTRAVVVLPGVTSSAPAARAEVAPV